MLYIRTIVILLLSLSALSEVKSQDTLLLSKQDTLIISPEDTLLNNEKINILKENQVVDQTDLDFQLILAAEKGYSEEVMDLLNKGADINTKTADGVTPLMYASQNGHFTTVKILVLNSAKVNAKPYDFLSALHGATISDQFEIAEFLIQNGAEIDMPDVDSITPLMYSSGYNYLVLSDMLIYYGADIFSKDIFGNDALLIAAFAGNIDIVELLIKYNANVNTTDNKGITPLMLAALNGNIDLVKLLCENGAEINTRNKFGYSAMAHAIKNGNEQIVEYLLKNGADINDKVSPKLDVLTLAKMNNRKNVTKILRNYGVKNNLNPYFDKISLSPLNVNWNFDDFIMGLKFGISETKYNFDTHLGFDIRPFAKRILINNEGDLYYQYWERRSVFYLEIDKNIALYNSLNNSQLGLFFGVKELYTFGGYKGSTAKANNIFILVPRLGAYWRNNFMGVKINYEHMDFDAFKIAGNRINITLLLRFSIDKQKVIKKTIFWLE